MEQKSQVVNNNENDEKIKKYKKIKVVKWIIISLSIVVIVLEILALFNKISMLWGCGIFVIITLLKYYFKKLF